MSDQSLYREHKTYWACDCGHRWDKDGGGRPKRCPKCKATRGLHAKGYHKITLGDFTFSAVALSSEDTSHE